MTVFLMSRTFRIHSIFHIFVINDEKDAYECGISNEYAIFILFEVILRKKRDEIVIYVSGSDD